MVEKSELIGDQPYWLFHPRVKDHPGPVLVIGCLNYGPYTHQMRALGKEIIGVDPQTTVQLDGVTHIKAVVSPFHGTAMVHGHDGGASLFWFHQPAIGTFDCVTMDDILNGLEVGGRDLAALEMNCEGSELFVLSMMTRPYADQITVGFHDRPDPVGDLPVGQGEPYLPSMRDALIQHLSQWYDYVQLTPREDNDWWFFLRRP